MLYTCLGITAVFIVGGVLWDLLHKCSLIKNKGLNSAQQILLTIQTSITLRAEPSVFLSQREEKTSFSKLVLVFTKSVYSNFSTFWLAPVLGISLAIHCFATRAKLTSRFKTFSKDGIWAINHKAVVKRNTRRATNFGLSVFTGR